MKFSVIIPVYNAEKTLGRCLDSLVKQLPEDVEIILVNDGSTDGSEEIALQYAGAYRNIIYRRHENAGVSYTRNVGLTLASGEYILFVDSDDYVAENYFDVLNENLAEQPDLLLFGFYVNGIARSEESYSCNDSDAVYCKTGSMLKNRNLNFVWSKVFKKSILEKYHICFEQTLSIGEDLLFVFSYVLHSGLLKSIEVPIYYVDNNSQNSLSRKRRDNLCDQLFQLHKTMLDMMENAEYAGNDLLCDGVEWTYYRSVYSISKELLKYDMSSASRIAKIREVCEKYRMNRKLPRDIKTCCIALPIHLRMAWMIDLITGLADWRKKRR